MGPIFILGRRLTQIMASTRICSHTANHLVISVQRRVTPAANARIYCESTKLACVRRPLLDYHYLEDDRDKSLWKLREIKDIGDERWRRELDDIEMYPLPR